MEYGKGDGYCGEDIDVVGISACFCYSVEDNWSNLTFYGIILDSGLFNRIFPKGLLLLLTMNI
jgi:hypothetical protein